MSTYDDVVAEVAKDLGIEEQGLREKFTRYLHTSWEEHRGEEWAACYAVYVVTKSRSAFRMAERSRNAWRERAMSLGSPDHLRRDPR